MKGFSNRKESCKSHKEQEEAFFGKPIGPVPVVVGGRGVGVGVGVGGGNKTSKDNNSHEKKQSWRSILTHKEKNNVYDDNTSTSVTRSTTSTSIPNFSFGKLKDQISESTTIASKKLKGLADKHILSQREKGGGRERSNDPFPTADFPSSPGTEQQQPIKPVGPSSSTGLNGQTITRTLKNAVVSQIPLPCVYCNAVPMQYQCHPFWGPGQRICSTHDFKTIPKCLSCHKFQSQRQRFHEIGTSGSLLCPSCAKTAILDNTAATDVFHEVLTFFQSYGLNMFNGTMHRIPIRLCTPPEMKQKFNTFKGDNSADQYGVCCWTEIHSPLGAAVGLIGAAGLAAARGIHHVVSERTNNKKLTFAIDADVRNNNNDMETTTTAIRRNPFGGGRYVSISQIAALKGLPRVYLGNIIAHEATHAWLALNPSRKEGVIGESVSFGVVRRLPLLVEEGTCQLVSHLYLDTILCNHNNNGNTLSSDEVSIIQYNLWGIENHGIYEYGEGYKQAARAYNQVVQSGGNLQELLEYISIHKSFPPS